VRDLDGGARHHEDAHAARGGLAPAAQAEDELKAGCGAMSDFSWLPPAKPMGGEQYFEDFAPGDVFRARPVTLTEADIVEFARRYDPQAFHVDKAAAERSQFGGLIASGLQVMAATFATMIEAGFLKGGGMDSPGMDEVRWHKPARPGDTLVMQARVTEIKPSTTRADRGYVTLLFEVINQRRERVMSYSCVEILKRRAAATRAATA
jgi:acyl dehydratase